MAISSTQSGSPFVPGSLIAGKYRLIKSIGEGAMGVVWSAVNEMTSGHVALKLIWKPEPEYRQRLLREAQACGRLRHKNIIQIHDVGMTEGGDPFLVIELLSGETLAELLARKRRLPPAEAASVGRDIARGLAVAHHAGVIHRDLKPANIFLHNEPGEERPVVKVLDFGVAKNLSNNDGLRTATGGAVGSPMYMSPEQAMRAPDIDYRADLWSLGVVMFEMLTGERPFRGDLAEVLHQIQEGEIPTVGRRIRKIDPNLDAAISGCLTRDREERLGPAGEIANILDEHADSHGRDQLPSLTEDQIKSQLAASGASPSAGGGSSGGGALTSSSGSHPRAPEPRPSNSGHGPMASPGYGAQSPGYGPAQSPGYAAQSTGYAPGQSPGYGGASPGYGGGSPGYGAGTGGIGLTAAVQPGDAYPHTTPLGSRPADDDAATARMQPRMMAPRAGSGAFPAVPVVTTGEIGPSGTVRIDPDAVEKAIAARGGPTADYAPAPLPAPPPPTASSPGFVAVPVTDPIPPRPKPMHPTVPMLESPVASTTAPLFQDPSAIPPASASTAAGKGKSKIVLGIVGAVVGVAVLAGVALIVKSQKGADSGMEALPTATVSVTAPPPPPATPTTPSAQIVPTAPSGDPSAKPTSQAESPKAPVTAEPKPPVTASPKATATASQKPPVKVVVPKGPPKVCKDKWNRTIPCPYEPHKI